MRLDRPAGAGMCTCSTASWAMADGLDRVVARPGRPAWTTTSMPRSRPACRRRVDRRAVEVGRADDDALRGHGGDHPCQVIHVAQPQPTPPGGDEVLTATDDPDDRHAGLGVDLGDAHELHGPGPGSHHERPPPQVAAPPAVVQPRPPQRAPGDQQHDTGERAGHQPWPGEVQAGEAVGDDQPGEDPSAGAAQPGELEDADGQTVLVPQAAGPAAR